MTAAAVLTVGVSCRTMIASCLDIMWHGEPAFGVGHPSHMRLSYCAQASCTLNMPTASPGGRTTQVTCTG